MFNPDELTHNSQLSDVIYLLAIKWSFFSVHSGFISFAASLPLLPTRCRIYGWRMGVLLPSCQGLYCRVGWRIKIDWVCSKDDNSLEDTIVRLEDVTTCSGAFYHTLFLKKYVKCRAPGPADGFVMPTTAFLDSYFHNWPEASGSAPSSWRPL